MSKRKDLFGNTNSHTRVLSALGLINCKTIVLVGSSVVSKALRSWVNITDRRISNVTGVQEYELKVLILNINIAQYL